ncbi:MAG: UxaA family hydrolase [Gammaproteobacteria bacterium]
MNSAQSLALLAQQVVNAGGLIVIPANASLLQNTAFRQTLLLDPENISPTLAYGQAAPGQGLHIMETPTDHAVETLTGLGATGVEVILTHQTGPLLQAHPMIPVLQVSADPDTQQRYQNDLDLQLDAAEKSALNTEKLLAKVLAVASGDYTPRLLAQGNTDFQLTRGLLGLSL